MGSQLFDRLGPARGFSQEESLLLDALDRVCNDIIGPNAAEIDRTAEFPWENIRALNDLGLNQIFLPESCGGDQLSYAAYLECVRRISYRCASTGIIWATNFHAMKPVIDRGRPEQVERLLPAIADGGLAALCITEPEAGSDATAMRLRMSEDGDDVVLDGSKTFITNGDVADRLLVFGKWAGIEDPRAAITAVVVEGGTQGLSTLGHIEKMGTRGSSTATLAFDSCRVPKDNVIGEIGGGLELLLASLNKSRPSVAAHALGIARAALDAAVGHINDRTQSKKRIIEFQGIQFMVADLVADLVTAEQWLWHVADLVDAGTEGYGIEASILKLRATDAAMRVTTDAVQLFGGYGYCREYPVERLMRDAKITQIWEGTNQIHRQLIGRSFVVRRQG
ncbi:MAG: acyl-CoA dehydrogenase family protein [Actinomycetota bacterium]|nr:acyl-CoA dehydrogenase family protein [Actinomycetota bacterium]